MEVFWTTLLLNAYGIDGGLETAFLGTRSGLMRMIRYVSKEKRVVKKFLSPSDKENILVWTFSLFGIGVRQRIQLDAFCTMSQ
ncbi:voltage-dependent calcium channel subunit alpha-2/delta-4-like [Carassius gibelio]|uniref:voltage-dependent calcium channel subunit alpha-2/delta-4-like n=1 Tax=Carassius gibelio TaxID=101364 RepID=UPI002277D96F|nr:voltage-dependent calcium channel subunit alpha-2/delta-4-like [Carassius gibelio]